MVWGTPKQRGNGTVPAAVKMYKVPVYTSLSIPEAPCGNLFNVNDSSLGWGGAVWLEKGEWLLVRFKKHFYIDPISES
jgi:hypothetical protein